MICSTQKKYNYPVYHIFNLLMHHFNFTITIKSTIPFQKGFNGGFLLCDSFVKVSSADANVCHKSSPFTRQKFFSCRVIAAASAYERDGSGVSVVKKSNIEDLLQSRSKQIIIVTWHGRHHCFITLAIVIYLTVSFQSNTKKSTQIIIETSQLPQLSPTWSSDAWKLLSDWLTADNLCPSGN